jgi:hypothetical protein
MALQEVRKDLREPPLYQDRRKKPPEQTVLIWNASNDDCLWKQKHVHTLLLIASSLEFDTGFWVQ